jgi:hypothetical protein
MTKSELFTKAHALTRATVQTGDSYAATFGLCLKAVYRAMTYQAPKKIKYVHDGYTREHELLAATVAEEIARLQQENAELQASIDAGKPARRRLPTILCNQSIIAALQS